MTPTPQEHGIRVEKVENSLDDERVVISGMSGLYPDCNSVKELSHILYNKINPVVNTRWKYNHPEVPQATGKIPQLDRFDAQFFKVHYRLGNNMDSMARKILEQAYQAIYDAGMSPEHLSGKNIGVYIGTCFSETEKACFYVAKSRTGFGITGCSRTMFANRISYWLNAKGPSLSIDAGCCSSIAALELAYLAISRGECEAAIVGGANLCLHPQSSVHYGRIMTLAMDGKTKSFDQNADGVAKSEAINVLLLQKAKDALRIYADILHVKTEFTEFLQGETGPKFGLYRDPNVNAKFLRDFYKTTNVSPKDVEYVEAVGSAVPEVDKAELESIDEVFCKDRSQPLLVGSVMSNIGYGEAAAGISSITKVLLGYHYGELAANLHCENPRQDVAALREGRINIVREHQTFNRSYAGINGISVTGVNAHVLLRGHNKFKDINRYKSAIPHLVTISGRQESSVKKILDDFKTRPIDPEELALFHTIHETRISGHLGRGFALLDTNEENKTISVCEKVDYFDDVKRPLWFVYSGMGSQWAGMGAQLMRIPIFSAAIERCRQVLEPKGVDIVHIITSPDKTIFDNILNSFVGIAAIQIGLTDILRELGLVPDKIIGHSVGELGCAYADECFTAEEMILSAYSRGLVSVQTPFIHGSMAAVGVGYEKISKMVPPEIEVACHNGPESSTISGPAEKMREFVAELTNKGIFAKEVPCSNIAYHSRYIAEAGPGLLKYLSEVIKAPKLRSDRWVSTSVPQHRWNESSAKYSSAEYHTNNLLSPVLFEETSRLVPANAVLVEIAPHGLLQAILKRSLPGSCHHVPLTRRGHSDNAVFLLEAIGKLYMEGYNPKVQVLYPKIEFPVSTGTPMLSHHVEWAHQEKWALPLYLSARRKTAAACEFIISTHDTEYDYLQGNVIRGKNIYPFAGALVAVWDTLAMSLGVPKKQLSVQFRDVHLHSQPILHDQRQLRLSVTLQKGTGRFEVLDGKSRVVTGFVIGDISDINEPFSQPFESNEDLALNLEVVYQLLYEKDYSYQGEFQSIFKSNSSFTEAEILWSDNWVTFIDALIQLNAVRQNHDTVSQSKHIRRMCIDINEHFNNKMTKVENKTVLRANVFEMYDYTRCGGVLIENLKFHFLPPLTTEAVTLKPLKFICHYNTKLEADTALQAALQTVAENVDKDVVNVVEIVNQNKMSVFTDFNNIVNDIPDLKILFEQIEKDKILDERGQFLTDTDAVLIQNLSADDIMCQTLYRVLRRDAFVLNVEYSNTNTQDRPSGLYRIVSSYDIGQKRLELIRWRPSSITSATSAVSVRTLSDLAMVKSTRSNLPPRHKLLIIANYPPVPGLKELVRKWRRDVDRNQIYLIMINHKIAEDQHLDKLPELDLSFNVLDHGAWGGEYYIPWKAHMFVKRDVILQSGKIGDLDSLRWVETPEPSKPGIKVTVQYTSINDLDVKRATGIIPFKNENGFCDNHYGMDFSGISDRGERVMGIIRGGAVSGRVVAQPELLWPVPAHWSMEDAATVPLPYAQAFYCLGIKAQIIPGMSILVHDGSSAFGQAAISVALGIGCEVFTTVSDIRKKHFLRKLFPALKDDHIGSSTNHSFADMVLRITNGRGCDVVINCVKGELKNTSLNCCAPMGIVFDTVQIHNQENYAFGMSNLTAERNYVLVDFSSIFQYNQYEDMKDLQLMISTGIARGYVRPLTRVTYSPDDTARAFQLIASSKHRGRVVISLKDTVTQFEPRIICSPEHCHLILSDEEHFGLQFAERLIKRGAKKIHIHLQSTQTSSYGHYKMESWRKLVINVKVSSNELKDSKSVISFINESNRIGTVEGIYVIASKTEDNKTQEVMALLANIDLASRKLCPAIKYFAVMSTGYNIGQQTCFSRTHDHLPASAIQLPKLKQLDDKESSETSISLKNAINASERALRSSQSVVMVYTKPQTHQSLLHDIAYVAGIKLPEAIDDDNTLQELGMELEKSESVQVYLRNMHNISLSEEEIPALTVQRIRDFNDIISRTEFEKIQGLDIFFSHVDSDELLATTEFVMLPTLTHNASTRDDELDVNLKYLCIVPGLEGHHEKFRILCERLKLSAFVLQPGLDRVNETIQETAQRYAKILLKKFELKKNFYLLGYESGLLVALEVAAILEDHGLVGTVFCLGTTPEELQFVLDEQLSGVDTKEELQDVVICHMYSLIAGSKLEELKTTLREISSWKEKIEACVRAIRRKVAHSAQYAGALIEAAYARIGTVREYTADIHPLKSRLVLLHATSPDPAPNTLQRYSQQPVVVHELHVPLANVTKDLRCAAIINQYLDKDILDDFDKRNLCETYLINADTFMTHDDE